MNRYGSQAMRHWSRFLPSSYAEIADPETFFTRLGLEVESEIDQRADQLISQQGPSSDYLQQAGRVRNARMTATEQVLAERVLLPAEPGSPMDETPSPEQDPAEAAWLPIAEDLNHSGWQRIAEQSG